MNHRLSNTSPLAFTRSLPPLTTRGADTLSGIPSPDPLSFSLSAISSPRPTGRRDPGWRKPVPKYIPSPPPSPPPSSPISEVPFHNLSLAFAGAALGSDDLPPLPVDWRDAIERALTRDRWTKKGDCFVLEDDMDFFWSPPVSPTLSDNEGGGLDRPTTMALDLRLHYAPATQRMFSDGPISPLQFSPPLSPAPPPKSPPTAFRHSHHTFRPPTPPVPAHYRKRRVPSNDPGMASPLSKPYRISIFPDAPMVAGSQDTVRETRRQVDLPPLPSSTSINPSRPRPETQFLPPNTFGVEWDVPMLPFVLAGPSLPNTITTQRSDPSIATTKVEHSSRSSASDGSSSFFSMLFCIRRRPKAKEIPEDWFDVHASLPTYHRRDSIGSTLVHQEHQHSASVFQAVWGYIKGLGHFFAVKPEDASDKA
ncbi:hypothetical protein JAAARDRAFT_28224 [Jaapia argillacea MUCL 33604]|uniref:Uncharacterized protein n=1 Tax=Jaapia argillacea MUCL 33604 TaxID=933084 RepID=A0A067QBY2_9AGAM|nr:hypothetical protein JAAARDRAFT_28224 [Jaapia argillacea MUCL 33604]